MSDNKSKKCKRIINKVKCNNYVVENTEFCDMHKIKCIYLFNKKSCDNDINPENIELECYLCDNHINKCKYNYKGNSCKYDTLDNSHYCEEHKNRCIHVSRNGYMCSKKVEKDGDTLCKKKNHYRDKQCKWKLLFDRQCTFTVVEGTNGCIRHNKLYLQWDNISLDNFIRCRRCNKFILKENDKNGYIINRCKICIKTDENYKENQKATKIYCCHIKKNSEKCSFEVLNDDEFKKIILKSNNDYLINSNYVNEKKYCGIHIIRNLQLLYLQQNNLLKCLKNGCYYPRTLNNHCKKCCNNIRIFNYKRGASKRGIEFNIDDEYVSRKINNKCYYCGILETINGIDRVNNFDSYNINNIVSCCTQCNFMKLDKTLNDFVKMCHHITMYRSKIILYPNLFHLRNKKMSFNEYVKKSEDRTIIFNLTEKEYNKIIERPCNYCGLPSKDKQMGIDRIDSKKGYELNNCVPCCMTCNIMKNEYSLDSFYNKCKLISDRFMSSNDVFIENELIKRFNNIKNNKKNTYEYLYDNEYLHDNEYYKNKVFNGKLNDLNKMTVEIIVANGNKELMDIWNFYRNNVSSFTKNNGSHLVGRQIYILVKLVNKNIINDKDNYIGVLSLSSDFKNIGPRDKYIGWKNNENLDYLMNISTCVPLQPFGFNFCGGKLLTMLCFSKEISQIFHEKYKTYDKNILLGLTTFSLHGESIQYDRLKCLKYLGLTKGYSSNSIDSDTYKLCKQFLINRNQFNEYNKLLTVTKVLNMLNISQDGIILRDDNKRGIYFGYIYPDAKKVLLNDIPNKYTVNDINKLKSIHNIFVEWRNRWADNRYINLNSHIKLKRKVIFGERRKTYTKKNNNKCDSVFEDKLLICDNPVINNQLSNINRSPKLSNRPIVSNQSPKLNKLFTKNNKSNNQDINKSTNNNDKRKKYSNDIINRIYELKQQNAKYSASIISDKITDEYKLQVPITIRYINKTLQKKLEKKDE